MKTAAKRYFVEFSAAMSLYVVAILCTSWFVNTREPDGALLYGVALLPFIPTILVFIAIMRFVFRMDELQQRIVGISAVISATVVGLTSFAYGLLESYADVPSIPMVWIMPALFGVYGLAQCFVIWRYK